MKPRSLPVEPTEAAIRHAVYILWEQEWRPAGRDLEIWLSTRKQLRHAVHSPVVPQHFATVASSPARNAQPPGRKPR